MPKGPRPEYHGPQSKAAKVAKAREVIEDAESVTSANYAELRATLKANGVKPGVITALVKRLQAGDPTVAVGEREPVRQMRTSSEFIEAFQDRLSMVLHYVDEVALSNASLKDLAIAAGIFTEKVLLLKGQPTQIIDFTSRQQLHVLAPRLLAEAKRRGITLDGQATVVHDVPQSQGSA